MTPQPPPQWSDAQFSSQALTSISAFRDERLREDLATYTRHYSRALATVNRLFRQTSDLNTLSTNAQLVNDADMLHAMRYLMGPPISGDDLQTVAQVRLSPAALRTNSTSRDQVVASVLVGLDLNRFPWVGAARVATEIERVSGAHATAALMATQLIATARRNEGKTLQEQKVKDALIAAGFQEVHTRVVRTLVDAPGRGEFCGESLFGQKKADIVVRLWDDRVMPLECKVSNSATNSVKRLNGDAAAKADVWLRDFGRLQVVPSAVVAGVFNVKNLREAQANGLTVWWSHDLKELTDWIETTKAP